MGHRRAKKFEGSPADFYGKYWPAVKRAGAVEKHYDRLRNARHYPNFEALRNLLDTAPTGQTAPELSSDEERAFASGVLEIDEFNPATFGAIRGWWPIRLIRDAADEGNTEMFNRLLYDLMTSLGVHPPIGSLTWHGYALPALDLVHGYRTEVKARMGLDLTDADIYSAIPMDPSVFYKILRGERSLTTKAGRDLTRFCRVVRSHLSSTPPKK